MTGDLRNTTGECQDQAFVNPDRQADIVLSLIMPVYNEAECLRRVLDEALETTDRAPFTCEIIAVDDASEDGSASILQEYQRRHPRRIRVLRHQTNRGIAAAFRTLDAAARGAYIFLIGSDGQWRMDECRRMMAMRDKYEVVVGRRASKKYSLMRKVISGAYNFLPVILFGVRTYDAGSIKLYRADVALIPLISRGVFDEAERLIRAQRRGLRIGAIDVEHLPRKGGRAIGVSYRLLFQAAGDLARCWWDIVILGRN